MDIITFEKIEAEHVIAEKYYYEYIAAKIIINGEDFCDMLNNSHDEDFAHQNVNWLHGQLTEPHLTEMYEGNVAILTCSCTVDECGGFFCKVEETETDITWSNFHDTSKNNAYASMPPLHFDKAAYKAELEKLKNMVAKVTP